MRNFLMLCMVLLFSVKMMAQSSGPKRTALYKMGANEVVLYNEYFISQKSTKYGFSCITYDSVKDQLFLLFNGKKITLSKEQEKIEILDVYSVNPAQDSDYVFTYLQSEKESNNQYINYKGVVDGPYDAVVFNPPFEIDDASSFDYFYKLSDRWFGRKNYKRTLLAEAPPQKKMASFEYKNGEYFLVVNGVRHENEKYEYEPTDLIVNKKGDYAFCFDENDGKSIRHRVNVNGVESASHDWTSGLVLTESGKYAYIFEDEKKSYLNINGTISKVFDRLSDLKLSDNGDLSYLFSFEKGDGRAYRYTNGKVEKTPYLAANFWLNLDAFANNPLGEVYSTNQEHSFISSYKYEYVVIDGKRYGKSPAIYYWYDSDKNAFIWNSIEGNELVVYEYAL